VVPHAGYMYSGAVAGAVYSALQIPAKCILIGPRHFPRGEAMAILTEGSWQTPFGEAQIDSALAKALAKACPLLREDAIAHEREHSLEVQLPFLQRLGGDVRFVPVLLGTDRLRRSRKAGERDRAGGGSRDRTGAAHRQLGHESLRERRGDP
jgi:AmmeMemoRadiSam system protein B